MNLGLNIKNCIYRVSAVYSYFGKIIELSLHKFNTTTLRFDEYTDHGFWVELVEGQAALSRPPNLRIVFLSSWGFAFDETLKVPGSALILLPAGQRMDLIPQFG